MSERKSQLPTFIGAGIVIVVLVFGLLSITEKLRQLTSSRQPQLIITAISPGSKLNVTGTVISTDCENETKIDYSLVDLTISGGRPPYELEIINNVSETSGPYTNITDSSPIRIKVYGGEFFIAQVQSSDNESWSGTIALPSEDDFCKDAPILTPAPSSTPLSTSTIGYTKTPIVIINPTSTSGNAVSANPTNTESITTNPFATQTNVGDPTITNSPNPPQTTNTSNPPQATNTPNPPQATNTPNPPQTTNTSNPPQATNTPNPPQPSPTPINPHPRECEDGIDNDGDGYIDSADPECKKPSDPHEDK